jgi:hypothetical protein
METEGQQDASFKDPGFYLRTAYGAQEKSVASGYLLNSPFGHHFPRFQVMKPPEREVEPFHFETEGPAGGIGGLFSFRRDFGAYPVPADGGDL